MTCPYFYSLLTLIMTSLLFRNLVFTILQPGIVCGLVPWLIVRRELNDILETPFELYQYLGLILIALGLSILLYCIFSFAKEGKGTLSPADPTKKLVIKGLYRYSRNPMYIGVLIILLGETIFTRSLMLGIYMFFVAVAFFMFITFFEEPRLHREFGEEYGEYRKKVRRWL